MKSKIAVVGDEESVMIFKAVGLDVHYADGQSAVEKAIHTLARDGYPVIYITEQAAVQAAEAIDMYAGKLFPAIIPIPGKGKDLELGIKGVKKNVEKAVGSDILFGKGR